ncbi:hypothetical protein LBMAG42_30880 [Deltaproteobacteria bacterium]|nr:hypothetical protein LBMAG42_30880 [Deltaproteobacteria bacterium]
MNAGMSFILFMLAACTGDEATVAGPEVAKASALTPEVIAATWQVRMAKSEARAPFEGRASWVAWFERRRYESLPAFASEKDNAGLARGHAEYAAIYRQAALLASNAILQVYGADRQESDPAETAYLLGVAGVFTGNAEQAAKLGLSGGSSVAEFARRDAAWKAWFDAKKEVMPDVPAGLAAVSGEGELPGDALLPTPLPLVGEPGAVDAGDPGDLYALSRWHEARARAADPASEATIDQYLNPFRLPFEARTPATAAVASDVWLFMSAYTSAADMQFSALVSQGDLAAAEGLAGSSAYASIAKACSQSGKVDIDCVIDEAAHLGSSIEDAMAASNGGQPDGFHRPFADFARAGALRALDLFARARGEDETSGILRINAYDRNVDHASDPVFILFLAAWDAGNRNTTRATELVHQSLRLAPGLVVARAPLDALHIRLSRNAAPGVPMH